jgi:hypothetical protein
MVNMTIWAWVAIAVTALAATSLLVGLAIATILGKIAHAASTLLDEESWASAPLTRALDTRPDEPASAHAGVPTESGQARGRSGAARERDDSVAD